MSLWGHHRHDDVFLSVIVFCQHQETLLLAFRGITPMAIESIVEGKAHFATDSLEILEICYLFNSKHQKCVEFVSI